MPVPKFLIRPVDRRRSPRFQPEGLAAYYWTGSVPYPREVREIGLHGAHIAGPDGFYPGTLVQIVFENQALSPNSGGANICVCAKAKRRATDGFSVEFLFGVASERRRFQRFLQGLRRKEQKQPNRTE